MLDKIIVTILGLAGIVFTYWFFLVKKNKEILVSESVDIIVEGGYSPNVISIPNGKTTKLNFIREDTSSCLEEVVLGDFKIRKYLPLNKKVTIELSQEEATKLSLSSNVTVYGSKVKIK